MIYLVALLSWISQITLLVGEKGLLPAELYFENVEQYAEDRGRSAFLTLPNLFWFTGTSNIALLSACIVGIFASLLVIFGRLSGPALLVLWVIYLSLVQTGGVFMSFQWDALLLGEPLEILRDDLVQGPVLHGGTIPRPQRESSKNGETVP